VYAFRDLGHVSMFITTDEGVILVDPIGFENPRTPQMLKAAVASVTSQPVRYVVYSHWGEDHAKGGAVFSDTAEFVGHENVAPKIAAANDPASPVPTITFTGTLNLELGGKAVQLRETALFPDDDYVNVHYGNVLMAVDRVRIRSLGFFQGAGPAQIGPLIEQLEADPSWTMFLYGHGASPAMIGTRADAREYATYLSDLEAAVASALAAGHRPTRGALEAPVREILAPRYGTWQNFDARLWVNVRGAMEYAPQ
jgi:glyoxylase-like metal-dependent hydrolase (beta-lactamase superfamily II)